MNRTIQYLQSDYTAEKGIEIGILVNHVLADAIGAGASDVHIEPWENTLVVRVRLSGVLTELVHLPLELMEKVSGRLKVMPISSATRPACRRRAMPRAGRTSAASSCASPFSPPPVARRSSSASSIPGIAVSIWRPSASTKTPKKPGRNY